MARPRRLMTERERKYLLSNHTKVTQREAAERLDRQPRIIWEWAKALDITWGCPKGYVRLRDVADSEVERREIARQAKLRGAYYRCPKPKMPHCVTEEFFEWYIQRRLRWTEADAIAEREGWYSTPDLAGILGLEDSGLSVKLRSGRKSLGKAFAGVKTMRGSHGRVYYEPQGTRLALAKLGVQIHRRAA